MEEGERMDEISGLQDLLAALRRAGFSDQRVLDAIAAVPRARFVPAPERGLAYADTALAIDQGQTISQPSVVAMMTQALALAPHERVLEIGTGSGYQTAVLAQLVGRVVSVERHAALSAAAAAVLADLGYHTVNLHVGDGTLGWPQGAPYDAVIVTAAGPRVPDALLDQLSTADGRLVMPVGSRDQQSLLLVRRQGQQWTERALGPVRFVPLLGAQGWPDQS